MNDDPKPMPETDLATNVEKSGENVENCEETPAVGSLVRQANGRGALLHGNPGNKGGGRYKTSLKTFLAELRRDPNVHAAISRAAKDETKRAFPAALKLMTDYDPNKPAEKRELSGQVVIGVVVEREGKRR